MPRSKRRNDKKPPKPNMSFEELMKKALNTPLPADLKKKKKKK